MNAGVIDADSLSPRITSRADFVDKLGAATPRLLCALIHKFNAADLKGPPPPRPARQLRHHKIGPAGVLGAVHQVRRRQSKPTLQMTEHRALELEVVPQEGRVELEYPFAAQQCHQHRAAASRHRRRAGIAGSERGDRADPARRVVLQRVEVGDAGVGGQLR